MNFSIFKWAVAAISILLLADSCTTSKQILYFQDIDTAEIDRIVTDYEPVIKRDDILKIVVSGPDKLVVQPYNLTLGEVTTYGSTSPANSTLEYHVDKDGYIDFPVLGRIKVLGMTRQSLVEYLTDALKKEVYDPVVYVSFANFKITVLGEVKNPGTYNVTSERITILQALGMAGDLNLTARRDGIILIREDNGLNTHIKDVTLFEMQPSLSDMCVRTIEYNGFERARAVCTRVQDIGREYDGAFSLVLCNPPYERGGFENISYEKAICRKEITVTLAEILDVAARTLKFGGRIAIINRADRVAELIYALKSRGLEPKRLQFVCGTQGGKPYLVMVEAAKGGKEGVEVLPSAVN